MDHIRSRPLSTAIAIAVAGIGSSTQGQAQDVFLVSADYQFLGDQSNDNNGTTAAGVGDIDGDGRSDFISGAPDAVGASDDGRSYVILGGPGAFIDSQNIGGSGFSIRGEESGDRSGRAVSGLGDVNGDGFADMLVSAPDADVNFSAAGGKLYVIFGGTTTDLSLGSDLGSRGFAIFHDEDDARAGETATGVGDVNGDGMDDILYMAPGVNRAVVVFGKTDGLLVDPLNLGSRGFTIETGTINNGDRVSGAGDVNGDGLDDLLIGKLSSYDALVVFGRTSPADINIVSGIGSEGFEITGAILSGGDVAGAGDVNGDGLDDVIIGAPQTAIGGPNRGAAFVIFGKSSTSQISIGGLTAAQGFRIIGADNDRAGYSVNGAGDFNGDGRSDLLVGVPNRSVASPGSAFVIFGKTSGADVNLDALGGGTLGLRMEGEYGNDRAGSVVASAGDVNGDGLNDVVIGAEDAYFTRYVSPTLVPYTSGKTYVVFSQETPDPSASFIDYAKTGDAPLLAAGSVGDQSNHSSPDGRFWIDFSDGSGPDLNGASQFRTTLHRDNAALNLGADAQVANVYWQTSTNRTGFSPPTVTVRYVDSEISGINEADLQLLQGTTAAGPWTVLATTIDAARNQASAASASVGVFALAALSEFDLENAAMVPINDGGSDDLGSSAAGSPVSATYTIFNNGDVDLSVMAPAAIGTSNVTGFSVTTPPASLVSPSVSTSFTVEFTPQLDGAYGLDLQISNGDVDEAIFDLSLTGTAIGAPEIDLEDSMGAALVDGSGVDDAGNQTAASSVTRSFTILNTGTADLNVGTITASNLTNAASFSVTTAPASTVSPAGMTTFDVQFDVLLDGPFSLDIDIASDDTDENPYDFTISGTATGSPELDLEDMLGAALADGSGVDDAGTQTVGSVSRGFLIRNSGTADLNVGTIIASNLTNTANFSVTTAPASTVIPADMTAFDVQFDVLLDGPFSLEVDIASDDADENPYDFTISGTGDGDPEIDVQSPVGVSRGDGTTLNIGTRVAGPQSRTLTIENLGTAPLTLSPQPTASAFVRVDSNTIQISALPASLAPGATTPLTVDFDVLQEGTFRFDLDIFSDDADEATYDLRIRGTGTGEPEIGIESVDGVIADGAMDDLGQSLVGRVERDYTIRNDGTGSLTVGTVSGSNESNASGFDVITPAPMLIGPGATGNFVVEFFVTDLGPFTIELDVASDDADEDPYDIELVGEGTDVQVFPDLDNLLANDQFGAAVASWENFFAVGIPGSDATASDAGRVVVYRIEGNTLITDAIIDVPAGMTAANFGASLAMDDGQLLIGAPGTPSGGAKQANALQAALFERLGQNWQLKQPLTSDGQGGANDQFGAAVSLSGGMMIIGAPGDNAMGAGAGAAYAFSAEGGGLFTQTTKIMPTMPGQSGAFGAAVAASLDKFAIGSPGGSSGNALSGVASIFAMVGTNLNSLGMIAGEAGDGNQFGSALSLDGDNLVIGAPGQDLGAGAAYSFQFDGAAFQAMGQFQPTNPEAGAGFGTAVSVQGGQFAVGAPLFNASGSIFIYDDGELARTIGALPGQLGFGSSLSLGTSGLAIGAPDSNAAAGSGALQRDPGLVMRNGYEE